MTINDVMKKCCMNVDDVLNVQAIYGGTVTIAPDEHLGDVHRMEHQRLKFSSHVKKTHTNRAYQMESQRRGIECHYLT